MQRSTTIAIATPDSPSPSSTLITRNHLLHHETIVNPGTHAAKRTVLALYSTTKDQLLDLTVATMIARVSCDPLPFLPVPSVSAAPSVWQFVLKVVRNYQVKFEMNITIKIGDSVSSIRASLTRYNARWSQRTMIDGAKFLLFSKVTLKLYFSSVQLKIVTAKRLANRIIEICATQNSIFDMKEVPIS
ncbi:hypothetical protein EAG_06416 [Camponotus floridanus]|uniref:Uncharacterized protein n=1 Tax=Camponotus floridanus TaxID=104421 RepID=E2B037_CAMFO|nr:hypothetical protein EAG_06416 [Camponotus floridanus]